MSNQIQHPLALDENQIKQEFNISKFLGQVALSVTVALTARWVLKKWDEFTTKKSI